MPKVPPICLPLTGQLCQLKNLSKKISGPWNQKLASKELMSSKIKSPSQPIYPRAASSQPKLAPAVQKTSLDAQAEEIRKAWLQRPPARSS